jgi:NhaP-type Na+/H+ or K+/H+ antiporter
MLAIAGAAAAVGLEAEAGTRGALAQLALGAAVGVLIGAFGGWGLRESRRRGTASEEFTGIAVLALALLR